MNLKFKMLKPKPEFPTKKLAEVSVEFTEGLLKGIQLIGITINENKDGLFVLFPSYVSKKNGKRNIFHFLRPVDKNALVTLESQILDEYENQLDGIPGELIEQN